VQQDNKKAMQKVPHDMMEASPMQQKRRLLLTSIGLIIPLMANSCSANQENEEMTKVTSAKSKVPDSIGSAEMLANATIVLTLRAQNTGSGNVGDAQFRYPPDHPQYKMILKHVGILRPGESRSVKSFP
jgi:hypothetical protein